VDVDTALLRALTALAEELHYGRAAGRLGITQQAMSKRVLRLEAVTGRSLVDRSDRRVVRLTADGARLAAGAQEVLEAADRLLPDPTAPPGRLRIDVMDGNLVPMVWARRAARAAAGPGVDVVTRAPQQPADALVTSGEAHLAFGRAGAVSAPWPDGLHRRLVLLEPLSVLVPRSHAWAGLDQIPLAELRGHTLWFPMTDAPQEWRDLVAELGRDADLTVDTTGSTFGYQQWAADVTAGVAPPSLLGEEMPPPPGLELSAVPIVHPTPVFPWWALWRSATPTGTVDLLLGAMGLLGTVAPKAGTDVWLPASDALLLDPAQRPPDSLRLR